jgi:hypothetical protein
MQKYLFTVLIVASCLFVVGQTNRSREYNNQHLQFTIDQRLNEGFQYYFEDFLLGKVIFKDDSIGSAYLNYNILLGEIHFIDKYLWESKNLNKAADKVQYIQKLILDGVNHVELGEDFFVVTPRGIMLYVYGDRVQLLNHTQIVLKRETPVGAYGDALNTGAATQQSSIGGAKFHTDSPYSLRKLVISEYQKQNKFYLVKEGVLYKPNQKNIQQMFNIDRNSIKQFLKSNKLSFKKESDLIRIIEFANSFLE